MKPPKRAGSMLDPILSTFTLWSGVNFVWKSKLKWVVFHNSVSLKTGKKASQPPPKTSTPTTEVLQNHRGLVTLAIFFDMCRKHRFPKCWTLSQVGREETSAKSCWQEWRPWEPYGWDKPWSASSFPLKALLLASHGSNMPALFLALAEMAWLVDGATLGFCSLWHLTGRHWSSLEGGCRSWYLKSKVCDFLKWEEKASPGLYGPFF